MTPNNTQFEKSLTGLRAISLAPEEKGKMFKKLLHYAETHQPEKVSLWVAFVRFVKGFAPSKATSYKIDSQ